MRKQTAKIITLKGHYCLAIALSRSTDASPMPMVSVIPGVNGSNIPDAIREVGRDLDPVPAFGPDGLMVLPH
ncbi:MAG: hypothetical protein R8G34_22955 [Paracoccaceae bacterium]|nr:hypothetical protein [Paracoccaceae bacterium]